jgi:thioredoxin 2
MDNVVREYDGLTGMESLLPELAAKYNVRGIPNFIVFYGGRLVTQQAGLVDHNQMENWLRSAGPVSAA